MTTMVRLLLLVSVVTGEELYLRGEMILFILPSQEKFSSPVSWQGSWCPSECPGRRSQTGFVS